MRLLSSRKAAADERGTSSPGRARLLAAVGPRRRLDRRGELTLLFLVLLGIAIFFLGYWVGMRDDTFHTHWYSPLRGTHAAALAVGSVQGGAIDRGGNTPLLVTVRGLKILPAGERYLLYAVRRNGLAERCGVFTVGTGTTQVHLNCSAMPVEPQGWLVTRVEADKSRMGQIVLRSVRRSARR